MNDFISNLNSLGIVDDIIIIKYDFIINIINIMLFIIKHYKIFIIIMWKKAKEHNIDETSLSSAEESWAAGKLSSIRGLNRDPYQNDQR